MVNQYTRGKAKPYVEGLNRVDLKGIDPHTLQKHYEHQGFIKATIKRDDGGEFTVPFYLDKIQAGYGDRFYVLCNNCGKRVTYLLYVPYIGNEKKSISLGCRHCFNANYMSQQVSRGENDYHFYKMRQIGKKIDPEFNQEDLMYCLCPFKPKYMKQVTYEKYRDQFLKHQQAAQDNWITGAKELIKSIKKDQSKNGSVEQINT